MQEKELAAMIETNNAISDFDGLSDLFTEMTMPCGRKMVLMIDEVDKASNNQLFLDFLGMLRTKYLSKNQGEDYSFHSAILAGVHDVKTLKAKIRPEEKKCTTAPGILRRLDIVITFGNNKYIVELKIWRGEVYHREGINQLCDYLDRQHERMGYLLIYDLRKESGRTGEWEKIEVKGKKIFTAWV